MLRFYSLIFQTKFGDTIGIMADTFAVSAHAESIWLYEKYTKPVAMSRQLYAQPSSAVTDRKISCNRRSAYKIEQMGK